MSTATDQAQSTTPEAEGTESRYAVLFELEGIAGSGRQATFDVLKSIFGEQGYEIQPAHVSRFCLGAAPEQYMADLVEAVGANRQSAGKLIEDARSGIAMQLSSKATSLPAPIRSLLKAARDAGAPLAALTALSKATAEALMESLEMNELGVELFAVDNPEEGRFPRADSWLKVAKVLNRSPFDCGVIASTHDACKSALSAGMRCVALPDSFTAFEDFSGANASVDDLTGVKSEDVLLDLCPHIHE